MWPEPFIKEKEILGYNQWEFWDCVHPTKATTIHGWEVKISV